MKLLAGSRLASGCDQAKDDLCARDVPGEPSNSQALVNFWAGLPSAALGCPFHFTLFITSRVIVSF